MPEVTVTLAKSHTHAGRAYKPGDDLTLPLHDAQFLLANKVIKKLPTADGLGEADTPEEFTTPEQEIQ
ncbi:DUF7210 family protein [Azomonas macrocytogenes]|uniref:DUF7210 domain-containing protein n=1 Tax=Azomonas macrocytogenes TaxID=69962 RepID=A0A839T2L9_AZOMA|nr:hypothetical protein [Azomonas macrocytogenes]MBB3103797.1 hypothetical protein [Azomonas macrocytogenes]